MPGLEIAILPGTLLLYTVGIAGSLCQGIYNIMSYKIVYHIMDMRNYTKIM